MLEPSFCKVLVLGALHLSSFAFAASKQRDPPFRIHIGYFDFPLRDPEIRSRVHQAENNLTLWEDLRNHTLKYWHNNEQPLPDDEEISALRSFGEASGVDEKELEMLLERARDRYDAELLNSGNDSQALWDANRTDLSEKFLDEIDEEFTYIHHRLLAAFAGVGSPVDCSTHIDTMLDQMTEYEKAGMAAASTLMALLPTFLAFGSLFVPRSSEAFATSWLIGLGAALFSLGLPVKSLSCVRRRQVVELATLDKDPLDEISELGTRNSTDTKSAPRLSLEKLQQWTRKDPPQKYMRDFGKIREAVDDYTTRWHMWHVPAALIAAAQAVIFALAIEPLLKSGGIPRFIFACGGTNWTGLYLAVSAAANATLRLALWQLCDHEVVSIYSLSEKAKSALEALKHHPKVKTTSTQLPPLYPPLISKLHTKVGKLIKSVFSSYRALPEEHPPGASSQPVRDQFEYMKFVLRDPMSIIRSGFTETTAAPRWRPLVVLIHLSTTGRPQLRTLLTGFCEAGLLLALTFFFAAQWGGNLYITAIALALLLVFITLGRALAIVYVWVSAKTWGLHTINCDEQEEIQGCLRIVCSMQGVLVTVNGAHYYDGYRLDYNPEFKKWRTQYASGAFDAPIEHAEPKNGNGLPSVETKKPETTVATNPVGPDLV